MKKAKVFFEEFLNKISSGDALVEKTEVTKEGKKNIEEKKEQAKLVMKNIQVVLQMKKNWQNLLSKVLNAEETNRLHKYTNPCYIENNILYVQVSQSDEQFFLIMHQKKILKELRDSKNEFLYPNIVEQLTQIVATQYIV